MGGETNNWVDLLGLSRAEQKHAKDVLGKVRTMQAVAGVVGLVALFVTDTAAAFVLGGIVLGAQIAAWWWRRVGMRLHALAEEARRRTTLISSLGTMAERLDVVELRRRFSKHACEDGPNHEDPSYWAATEDLGPARLVASTQEAAFYSKHLYEAAGQRAVKVSCVALAVAVLALVGSLVLVDGDAELAVARVVVGVVSGLMAVDELGLGLAWLGASRQAADVDRRLEAADPALLEPLVVIFGDYSVATASVAPIPDAVYEREKDRLAQLWAQRVS